MQTPLWYGEMDQVTEGKQLLPLDVPTMSLDERDRRWSAVREKMFFRGLECLILVGTDSASSTGMANVRYLTQLGPIVGAFGIFPLSGDPVVFYGAPHMHIPTGPWRQIAGGWIEDVRPDAGVKGILDGLAEAGLGSGRIGVVGYRHMLSPLSNVPAAFLDALRRGLPDAVITDETAIVDEVRLIKSEEEKQFLRRAGEIAVKRIERMMATAKPGVTEAEVWAAMEHEAIINGGEPGTFNLLSSGPVTGSNGRVVDLLHGSEPPHTATLRELQEGDLIICEFHTSYGGYLAGTEFSVFIGEAPPQLVRLHDAAAEIVRMAKDLFTPGRSVREVHSAFHRYIEGQGFDFIELGFHGHGLASPEFPAVVYREADLGAMWQAGVGNVRLRENMVFGLNIDVHDPAWRRDVGVMLGDMVAVTPDGAEYMCKIPLDAFEVAATPV